MLRRTLAHHAFAGCNPPLMKAIRDQLGRPDGGVDLQEACDVVEHMPEEDIFKAMYLEIMFSHYHAEDLSRCAGNLLGNVCLHSTDETTNKPGGIAFNIRQLRAAISAAEDRVPQRRDFEYRRPKVTIEVLGGVAAWKSSGEVDVELIDYDNEPNPVIDSELPCRTR